MNNTKMLIGSLSNDLYRVATLANRGSIDNAKTFHKESQRWIRELEHKSLKPYMKQIILHLKKTDVNNIKQDAEDYLMYSILLQNYALHFC